MENEEKKCRLCGENVQCKTSGHTHINRYEKCACGAYYAADWDLDMSAGDFRTGKYEHLPALLYERSLKGNSVPFLVFDQSRLSEARENVTFIDAITVDDLLAQWPETVPERIDRVLCNLARFKPRAGDLISLTGYVRANSLCFAADDFERGYYMEALKKYEWIDYPRGPSQSSSFRITPKGWAHYHELIRETDDIHNPVFVAMWFGKKGETDRTADMQRLFDDTINPAIKNAGYLAERSDTVEHNDFVMDRILEDIRRAPFLVAEMTENIPGVYFEAGFARGLGIEVVYCVRNDQKVHFDLTGINHVRWTEESDLRRKLENRILGTMGRGPHKFDVA